MLQVVAVAGDKGNAVKSFWAKPTFDQSHFTCGLLNG